VEKAEHKKKTTDQGGVRDPAERDLLRLVDNINKKGERGCLRTREGEERPREGRSREVKQ